MTVYILNFQHQLLQSSVSHDSSEISFMLKKIIMILTVKHCKNDMVKNC